ncbi:MAG: hypothetical protein HQK83_04605 [Fibrobacteria bacterium]|nr:hypothetical protein [Fibrobacteria bacterium]
MNTLKHKEGDIEQLQKCSEYLGHPVDETRVSMSITIAASEEEERLLANTVIADLDADIRKSALRQISSQDILKSIMERCSFPATRKDVIDQLTDINYLKEVVENDPHHRVSRYAEDCLNNEIFFLRIACEALDWHERYQAIEYLRSEESIIQVAKNDSNENVRRKAVERLESKDRLWEIAKTDPSFDVRVRAVICFAEAKTIAEAIEKISDPEVLEDIAKNSDYNRRKAKKRLLELT